MSALPLVSAQTMIVSSFLDLPVGDHDYVNTRLFKL